MWYAQPGSIAINAAGRLIDPDFHHYFCGQLELIGRRDLASYATFLEERWIIDGNHGQESTLSQISNPILCLCSNPVDIDAAVSRARKIWAPDDFFVLTWDANAADQTQTAYWPYFFLEQRRQLRSAWRPRQHRISMLSGQVRPHRVRAWLSVRDLIRTDDVVVINSFGLEHVDLDDLAHLAAALPWANIPVFLDQAQYLCAAINTAGLEHPAFAACVNVTGESLGSDSGLFVTEKTWKSLAAGCLPLHTGCAGMAEYLQTLGFQNWFGNIGTDYQAVRDVFMRDDIWDFYHANQSRVQQDLQRFWSTDLVSALTDATLTKLEYWLSR